MIYLSAKHIAIKKDQDRAGYDANKIVICDGVGEFNDSAVVAEISLDNVLLANNKQEIIARIEKSVQSILTNNIIGGTTLISAIIETCEDISFVKIAYLGNGSIFHLHGDYFELPASYNQSNKAYRFSNILIPHIDKEGSLLRHISHDSKAYELTPSFIDLSLTGISGDIILIFSDGISTLEEDIIVMDDQQRIWRNQSSNVSIILNDLHEWLILNSKSITQRNISDFLESTLKKFKEEKKLEDDASIGLIITQPVLNYYKEKYHVT